MATVNQQIDALLKRRTNPRKPGAASRADFRVHDKTRVRDYGFTSESAALAEAKQLARLDIVGDVYENTSKRGAAKWKLLYWFDSTGVYPAGSHGQAHTRLNPARKTSARSVVLVAAKNPRKAKPRLTSDQFETQYSKDGKTWHRWNVVLYEDMARKIARDVSRDFPTYSVRVVKL